MGEGLWQNNAFGRKLGRGAPDTLREIKNGIFGKTALERREAFRVIDGGRQ
jgi:hypothetical protein